MSNINNTGDIVRAIDICIRFSSIDIDDILYMDNIVPKFNNIDLVWRTNTGAIYKLDGCKLIDMEYVVHRSSANTPSSTLVPEPVSDKSMLQYGNTDASVQYSVGMSELTSNNNAISTQYSVIEIKWLQIVSPRYGYAYIPANQLIFMNDNNITKVKCLPEIVYCVTINNMPWKYARVNDLFTDYGALHDNSSIDESHVYRIHSFGYDVGHDGRLRVFNIALRDTTANKIATYALKKPLIEGHPLKY